MIYATVRSWAAWSPGVESEEAWLRWCQAPSGLASEGRPDAAFLPAMLRRRCGTLARIMFSGRRDDGPEADLKPGRPAMLE